MPGGGSGDFSLSCAKEDFKFSSAHFVSHGGGREMLHGHNYRVYVSLQGTSLGAEGVVMDFSELKRVVRALCKELDEKFLCPMASTTCLPTVLEKQVELRVVGDGTFFSLPRGDVLCLPLANTTVEELSMYLAQRIVAGLGRGRLGECGIHSVTVGVTETPGQECRYTVSVAGGAEAGGAGAASGPLG